MVKKIISFFLVIILAAYSCEVFASSILFNKIPSDILEVGFMFSCPGWDTMKKMYEYGTSDQEMEGRKLGAEMIIDVNRPILDALYNSEKKLWTSLEKQHKDFEDYVQKKREENAKLQESSPIVDNYDDLRRNYFDDLEKRDKKQALKLLGISVQYYENLIKETDIVNSSIRERIIAQQPKYRGIIEECYKNSYDTWTVIKWWNDINQWRFWPSNIIDNIMIEKRAKFVQAEYRSRRGRWKELIDNQKNAIIALSKQFIKFQYNDEQRIKNLNEKLKDLLEQYEQKLNVKSSLSTIAKQNSIKIIDIVEKKHNDEYEDIKIPLEHNIDVTTDLLEFSENSEEFFYELEYAFERETELNKQDMMVLLGASALQVLRQCFYANPPKRLDDQSAAKNIYGNEKYTSDRLNTSLTPSLKNIQENPVPYDLNLKAEGKLSGYGQLGHRAATVGHDPLIGFFVGTANILTGTVTTSDWNTYKVLTENGRDVFGKGVPTLLMFEKAIENIAKTDGQQKLVYALGEQVKHIKSDWDTKNSLPVPFLSSFDGLKKRFNPDTKNIASNITKNFHFASGAAKYGLDMANLTSWGNQFLMAKAIDGMVALFHDFLRKENEDPKLYEVKTNKVLMYSNVIASTINIGEVLFVSRDIKRTDVGGIVNTIFNMVTSPQFIKKVKRDFVFGKYDAKFAEIYDEAVKYGIVNESQKVSNEESGELASQTDLVKQDSSDNESDNQYRQKINLQNEIYEYNVSVADVGKFCEIFEPSFRICKKIDVGKDTTDCLYDTQTIKFLDDDSKVMVWISVQTDAYTRFGLLVIDYQKNLCEILDIRDLTNKYNDSLLFNDVNDLKIAVAAIINDVKQRKNT